ncbi:D-alanyl-D-alanine carboxypeptidase/D-alanyl-D-alanine endopeptidase [Kamptonema formosum]|uniref:D-alanyl-D-alanine carboxypeptidase/D-alanyl-D-alanine endopeptidase n=1 Tax=Kamptonema formosum TaxID=331992 RepID=UPI00034B6124|nr:D-alanyl-D-alanine carboxypeptidase/D-alanyl-D-alanine-endopeptidase [Oscillatoria sp. PCC 10802]
MAIKLHKKFAFPIAGLLLVLGGHPLRPAPAFAQPAPGAPICPAQLGAAIDAVANRPQFQRSRWGILVETLSPTGSRTLYSREGSRYFIPASNAKLLTTAAALEKLGPQFRIRTSVYGTPPRGGTVSLRVVGRGDPSLTDAELATLAQQLKSRGVTQVDRLIADDGYFQGEPVHPNWEWEDVQAGYGAPVSSLILNENAINLTLAPQNPGQPLGVIWENPREAVGWRVENRSRTVGQNDEEFVDVGRDLNGPVLRVSGQLRAGSEPEPVAVAITNPAENFLAHFRQALEAEGIAVARTAVARNSPIAGEAELAAVESPPLSELLEETNQESNNLYAEVLLRSLAAGPASGETLAAGLEVLKATLTRLGVSPDGYVPEDGSGLSRQNMTSPEALVQTLRAMASSPRAAIFRASLPVAGVSGSLKNRFRDTAAQGTVLAKTGTVGGVSALSGYVTPPDYPPLVFSIVVNQSNQSPATQRQAIDQIVLLLARLRNCS